MKEENRGDGAGSEESVTKDAPTRNFALNEWTDEKHSLFLKSIEESFIRQLYEGGPGPINFQGWLPVVKKDWKPLPKSNRMLCSQFKVLRSGCWETISFKRTRFQVGNENDTISFKRTRFQVGNENDTRLLFENPWIQRFTSRIIRKEFRHGPLKQIEKNELSSQLKQLGNQSLKQNKPNSSRIYLHHSFRSNTEVSDQNFGDTAASQGEKMDRKIKRKRRKTGNASNKDELLRLGKHQPWLLGRLHQNISPAVKPQKSEVLISELIMTKSSVYQLLGIVE